MTQQRPAKDDREAARERRDAALRENLRRRKEQARARAQGPDATPPQGSEDP